MELILGGEEKRSPLLSRQISAGAQRRGQLHRGAAAQVQPGQALQDLHAVGVVQPLHVNKLPPPTPHSPLPRETQAAREREREKKKTQQLSQKNCYLGE